VGTTTFQHIQNAVQCQAAKCANLELYAAPRGSVSHPPDVPANEVPERLVRPVGAYAGRHLVMRGSAPPTRLGLAFQTRVW